MAKVDGLSRIRTLPAPFVPAGEEREFRGRTVHDQARLDELWDSGRILDFVPSPPSFSPPDQAEKDRFAQIAAERRGMTGREYREASFGRTPAQDLAADQARQRLGLTQPTSKGPMVLEPNVLELRRRFGYA